MQTSSFLVQSSFWRGVASVANLDGAVASRSVDSPLETDVKALVTDWQVTGRDILTALEGYGQSYHRLAAVN